MGQNLMPRKPETLIPQTEGTAPMTQTYEDDDRMLARVMREATPKATLSPDFNKPTHLNPAVKSVTMPLDMVPQGKGWRLVTGNTFSNLWER
jgi:hypothetical protein